MANYCNYDDVAVTLEKKGSFSTDSTPTASQVTDIITEITGEIDTVLASIGVTSQPTDTNILAMLKRYCRFGSSGVTGMTYGRNFSSVIDSLADWLYGKYESFLEKIKNNPELFTTDSLTVSNQVLDGSYTEAEQKDIFMQSENFEV